MNEPKGLIPRPFPAAPNEIEALLSGLQRNRRTFAWKTGGLDADAMRRTLGPSTVSLGGLVKHLALVEDHYFTHQLLGRDYPAVWAPMADSPIGTGRQPPPTPPQSCGRCGSRPSHDRRPRSTRLSPTVASTARSRSPNGPRGPTCAGCSST